MPSRNSTERPAPEPLAAHGVDFVEDAVELLRKEQPTSRESRLGVVLLAMGVELLLKSRLLVDHWTLVFDDLDKARLTMFSDGTLKSAGPEQCLERLVNVCSLSVNDRFRRSLKDLWELRNKVVHFGGMNVHNDALRVRAFAVLSELFEFMEQGWKLNSEDWIRISATQDRILFIKEYVDKRRIAIADRIAALDDGGYWCPSCLQRTIDVRGGECFCVFCNDVTFPGEVFDAHCRRELAIEESVPADDKRVASCHSCSEPGFPLSYVVAIRNGSTEMRCLYCGIRTTQADLRQCTSCRAWVSPPPDGEEFRCPNCPEAYLSLT